MKRKTGRFALIILDGLGIGGAPDAEAFGDSGSNTIGNLARAVGGLELPYLESLGLGCCAPLQGLSCRDPLAAYGTAKPVSMGKDSTTGHWEICEVILEEAFPTYPDGFPAEVIESLSAATGRGVIGNKAASGTAIIEELGAEHMHSGDWIVYTSADSVFQIAAHEEVVPIEELYEAGGQVRRLLQGRHSVSRVIVRPFLGEPGNFQRTERRKDFSVDPVSVTLLDRLADSGVPRVGVGKVDDLFAGRNIESRHTPTNRDAYGLIADGLREMESGLLFANVIEFDQSWGHRNDIQGFYDGLRELDVELPKLVELLRDDDIMILTADHGNDPTTDSTDHSRECVPILTVGPAVRAVNLGLRETFADIGATIADYFELEPGVGRSFLKDIL